MDNNRSELEENGSSVTVKGVTNNLITKEEKEIALRSLGVDSGGSFTKIVYFRPVTAPDLPDYVLRDAQLPQELPGLLPDPNLEIGSGILKFIKFPRHKSIDFINFVQKTNLQNSFKIDRLNITGGGAYKFAETITEKLQISVNPLPEFICLIRGLNFLLTNDPAREVFKIDPVTKEPVFDVFDKGSNIFPYFLVNIGSGVSILKITGKDTFQRVSGTSLGGGTFWGLCRLLTQANSFDQVKDLASKGDSTNVDLLVKDIYGEESQKYEGLGLHPDMTASSFGKAATSDETVPTSDFKSEDIVRSLMFMIANNIGQIAFLNAKLHGIERVMFAGGFIAGNEYIWSRFAYAINFWSEAKMQALFLRHDGYLGALGAMLYEKND